MPSRSATSATGMSGLASNVLAMSRSFSREAPRTNGNGRLPSSPRRTATCKMIDTSIARPPPEAGISRTGRALRWGKPTRPRFQLRDECPGYSTMCFASVALSAKQSIRTFGFRSSCQDAPRAQALAFVVSRTRSVVGPDKTHGARGSDRGDPGNACCSLRATFVRRCVRPQDLLSLASAGSERQLR
jgi:hypothetical protein